jgi:hypothetical protein
VVNCEVARDVTPGVVHWTGPALQVAADRRRHPQFPVDPPRGERPYGGRYLSLRLSERFGERQNA